jgi:hypothetical protein
MQVSDTCGHVILCGQKDFADVIKLRIFRWGDYPALSGWAQCDHRVLLEEEGRKSEVREEM